LEDEFPFLKLCPPATFGEKSPIPGELSRRSQGEDGLAKWAPLTRQWIYTMMILVCDGTISYMRFIYSSIYNNNLMVFCSRMII